MTNDVIIFISKVTNETHYDKKKPTLGKLEAPGLLQGDAADNDAEVK